jgi:hypothetical protein
MARALPRRHHILPLTKFEMNGNGMDPETVSLATRRNRWLLRHQFRRERRKTSTETS